MKFSIDAGVCCVYMLKCRDGSLYTGWTNDFNKRFEAHSTGCGAKYTRGRGPVVPVYIEVLPDKIAATKREYAIKKLSAFKKRQLIDSSVNEIKTYFLE